MAASLLQLTTLTSLNLTGSCIHVQQNSSSSSSASFYPAVATSLPQLRKLSLTVSGETSLSDMAVLSALTNIQDLSVQALGISPSRLLQLPHVQLVTAIKLIANTTSEVQQLCTWLEASGQNLQDLELGAREEPPADVTAQLLKCLGSLSPKLRELHIGHFKPDSGQDVAALGPLSGLEYLRLGFRSVQGRAALEGYSALTALRKLCLTNDWDPRCKTGFGLEQLTGLRSLQELALMECPWGVVADAIQAFGDRIIQLLRDDFTDEVSIKLRAL